MKWRQAGDLEEKLAAELLVDKGYRIAETNSRCREGEIDVVAVKKIGGQPFRVDHIVNVIGEE